MANNPEEFCRELLIPEWAPGNPSRPPGEVLHPSPKWVKDPLTRKEKKDQVHLDPKTKNLRTKMVKEELLKWCRDYKKAKDDWNTQRRNARIKWLKTGGQGDAPKFPDAAGAAAAAAAAVGWDVTTGRLTEAVAAEIVRRAAVAHPQHPRRGGTRRKYRRRRRHTRRRKTKHRRRRRRRKTKRRRRRRHKRRG